MIQATLRKAGDTSAAKAAAAALATSPEGVNSTVADVAREVGDADLAAALGVSADGTVATQTALVKAAPAQVSRYAASSDGGFAGEWSKEDLKFPSLKIVQGSGPNSQKYKTGQVILGDEVLLKDPDPNAKPPFIPTMRFVPISLIKRWRENLSQDAYANGEVPRIFDTEQQVEEVGGTTQWIGRGPTAIKPSFSPSVTSLLLLEKPEGAEHPNFAIDLNGKLYAPCVYYATGTGFTHFAKPIFNAQLSLQIVTGQDAQGRPLKKTYVPKLVWTWETKKILAGTNWVFAPNVRMTSEQTTPEVRDFLREVTGGIKDEQVAAEE